MKNRLICYVKEMLMLFLVITSSMNAEISSSDLVRIPYHIPQKAITKSVSLGDLDATQPISVSFMLPLRNTEVLDDYLKRVYDPSDALYGKYLSTEDFVEQFAPTQADYDKVIAYAKEQGLEVVGTHLNRTLVNVQGNTESVEKAFKIRLKQYQTGVTGRKFYAPDENPAVASPIASIIHGIVGLDNYALRRSFNRPRPAGHEHAHASGHSFPSGPSGGYAPNDIITAYNLASVSSKGAGQVIALFELGGYQVSDITAYTTHFGLPTAKLKDILVDGGSNSGIDAEVTLDIQLALALAPESQIYVYEGPNSDQGVLDTYNRIATDNIAKQVSTSWGLGENYGGTQFLQAENAIFQQMAAQGQTIYAAAGDSGAYDNYPNNGSKSLVVDDPASQPYVVGVGGTKLQVNSQNGSYSSETVWNEGLGNGAGGGGVSTIWPIPTWQKNVPTTYSKTNRNVPDVALNADVVTGYSIYYDGQWTVFGGTSCAAPLWAAFTACLNQELAAGNKAPLGFANPAFYALGLGASADNYHDVSSGNNLYYQAGKGYDNATGWGSFNGATLFQNLLDFSTQPPPPPQHTPHLDISMSHSGTFYRGGIGTYQINVSNHGDGVTTGDVTVAITLPKGLSYRSISGSGWSFNTKTLTCTQHNTLPGGGNYPPITLRVNINYFAPFTVTPKVTVSGGGSGSSSASDQTSIKF